MNIVKNAFIKTAIFPVYKYFMSEFAKIREMAKHTRVNDLYAMSKFESEYARVRKEFDSLPKFVQDMLKATDSAVENGLLN
jgi:hypothetical protein